MFIMAWAAIAVACGLLVAWIAHRKGRELVPWWFYGTVAGVIALPHALLLSPRLEERRWTPIRFGLPSGPQACPFCHAHIHGDAVVCRHCGSPLYGAPDDAAEAAHGPTRPAASATARTWPPQDGVQQDLFTAQPSSGTTDAASQSMAAEAPENIGAGLRMPLPPSRRQSSLFGQFAIIMVLCAATALGTLWLTGPHLQDRDFLPTGEGEGAAVQGQTFSRPHAFLPPPQGDAAADAGRPQATGKPLALEPPPRLAVQPPEPLEAPPLPPFDPGLASDSTPRNLPVEAGPTPPPSPPTDLVRDVKSALGKLKSKSKKEDEGGDKGNETDDGGGIVASGDVVKDLQRRLKAKGFNPGRIDGRAGRQTVQAMRAFQRESGLPETENITRAVLVRLGIMQPNTPKMTLQVERPVDAGSAEAAAREGINIE